MKTPETMLTCLLAAVLRRPSLGEQPEGFAAMGRTVAPNPYFEEASAVTTLTMPALPPLGMPDLPP